MKKRKSIFVTFIIALMLILMTVFAYGEELEAGSYRDDEIEISFPAACSIEEIESSGEADGGFEHILTADMSSGDMPVKFDMYYSLNSEAEDYIYFHEDKESAFRYYDDYGAVEIAALAEEFSEDKLLSLDEADYYEGEWVTYLVVKAVFERKDGKDPYDGLVYITACSAGDMLVNKIMIFSGRDGNVSADELKAEAQPVVDSFYDYGYDEVMAGVSEDDTYYGESDEAGSLFGEYFEIFIGIVVLICVLLIKTGAGSKIAEKFSAGGAGKNSQIKPLHKKTKKKRTEEYLYKKPKGNPAEKGSYRSSGRKREENCLHKIRRRKEKPQSGQAAGAAGQNTAHYSEHGFSRPASAEDRYIESLETLLKSGLLTRSEMIEMIEKHNRMKYERR